MRQKLHKHLSGRGESLLAIASFGMSSVYWLGLAFVMSADSYGRMMTLQAAVMLVTTLVTLRTHDLVFNLIAQNGARIGSASAVAFRWEVGSVLSATLLCAAGTLVLDLPRVDWAFRAQVIAFAAMSSIGVNHGSSIAKLRYHSRHDIISVVEAITSVAWAAACVSMLFVPGRPPMTMLAIGALPPMIRALALTAVARTGVGLPQAVAGDQVRKAGEWRQIARFLAGAQLINFLKNGAVSIETMILAAFASPATVAIYRIARAMQGASNAAMNVSYQRAYPRIARAADAAGRRAEMSALRRSSARICLLFYPLSALVALGYALLKPDVDVIEIEVITAATFIAMLATGYQQAAFAALSIAGDNRSAGLAYGISTGFLLLASTLLFLWPSVEIFLMGIIGAAFVRLWIMDMRSQKLVR